MGRLADESRRSAVAYDLALALLTIRGPDDTGTFAQRFLTETIDTRLGRAVRSVCPSPALLAAAIPELRSEADCVAVITSVWPEPDRPPEIRAVLFEALFVLWRFGSRQCGEAAVREGRRLLRSAFQDQGRLHVRLAQLLEADNGPQTARHIELAQSHRADIPRALDPSIRAGASRRVVVPPRPGVWTKNLWPASSRVRMPPRGDPWHPVFDLVERNPPALDAIVVEDGTISLRTGRASIEQYVFDRHGDLIPELSIGDDPFIAGSSGHFETLALVDDWPAGANVCHLLLDKVTRLAAYASLLGDNTPTALLYLWQPYAGELFNLLETPWIHPDAPAWTVRADRLVFLSNHKRGTILHPAFGGAPHATHLIRERFQAPETGKGRLYISREDAAVRRNLNEEEVQGCFRRHGFEIRELSGLTLSEQRALLADAGHVAGLHGAGLTNIVFAGPQARLMELMPPNNGSFAYWVMASALNISYRLLTVDDAWLDAGSAATADLTLNFRDCRIDIDQLDAALAEFVRD